jgi:hypothetical protein
MVVETVAARWAVTESSRQQHLTTNAEEHDMSAFQTYLDSR